MAQLEAQRCAKETEYQVEIQSLRLQNEKLQETNNLVREDAEGLKMKFIASEESNEKAITGMRREVGTLEARFAAVDAEREKEASNREALEKLVTTKDLEHVALKEKYDVVNQRCLLDFVSVASKRNEIENLTTGADGRSHHSPTRKLFKRSGELARAQ